MRTRRRASAVACVVAAGPVTGAATTDSRANRSRAAVSGPCLRPGAGPPPAGRRGALLRLLRAGFRSDQGAGWWKRTPVAAERWPLFRWDRRAGVRPRVGPGRCCQKRTRLIVPSPGRVRPVHRFSFPRLGAVLVTATVVFVACAQGPGVPSGPEGTPPDTAPAFAVTVADQTYTEGDAISPLTLPEASGGNGTLSYSLTPTVPGLTFTAATRTLGGTPTSAGTTYAMTYQAVDGDANTAASDAATLSFTIMVQEPEPHDTAATVRPTRKATQSAG